MFQQIIEDIGLLDLQLLILLSDRPVHLFYNVLGVNCWFSRNGFVAASASPKTDVFDAFDAFAASAKE